MSKLSIGVDRGGGRPAFRQIADRVREAVAAGLLAPGDRLPPARVLAAQLGLARGTVDTAYALLAGEGFIEGRGAAGTIVSPLLSPAAPPPPPAPAPVPEIGQVTGVLPFRMGLPALDAFPRTLWSRLAARIARRTGPAELAYPDPAGLPELRESIAAYLRVARGIACTPDQVIVTAGFQGALALAAAALLRPGDPVWVEDPGYFLAHGALRAGGARLVPVPVDPAGLDVAAGVAAAPDARLAVVTPTHQATLGVALSLPRRLALLDWAARQGGWIVEDDYDGEFRYSGHPLPALKSLDRADRVLYAGSFSKVLFPALRLGYLVPPAALHAELVAASRVLQGGLPALEQRIVAAFLAEGHFARHIRKMRGLYAVRRAALADALAAAFGDRLSLTLQAGGMHLLARLADAPPDREMVVRALAAGLAPAAVSTMSPSGRAEEGLLLGFTNVAEAAAPGLAARLATAIGR